MFNKKLIMLGLSVVLSCGMLVGCGNQEEKVQENKQSIENQEKQQLEITNQGKELFEERDILSYEVLEVKRKDGYLMMKIKVTNNGDIPVNNHTMNFGLYDKEGTALGDSCYYDEKVLQPGKSANQDVYVEYLDTDEIQVTDYRYDVPQEKVQVEVNVELQTVDTNELE